MKLLLKLLILCFLLHGCFGSNESTDILNVAIPENKLNEDFYLLEKIVQQAHAGVYAYNTPAQIESLFDSINNTIDGPLTMREFYNKVDCALDRLCCIHTKSILPDDFYDSLSNRAMFFPVPLIVVGEKIYINSKAYNITLGSQVLSLNDIAASELIKKLAVYRHTDGHSDKIRNSAIDDYFAFNFYMAFGAFKKFKLKVNDAETGKVEDITVTAEKLKDIDNNAYNDSWYFFATDAPYDLEIKDYNSTAILTLRTFNYSTYVTSTAFDHFVDNSFRLIKQSNIRNLIIDCRNNGGGYYSSTYPVLSYLLDKPVYEYDSSIRRFYMLPYSEHVAPEDTSRINEEDSIRKYFKQIRPGIYREDKDQVKLWEPNDFVFRGRLFVITNPFVISAASTFVAVLRDRTDAYIIGEETAGNYAAHNANIFTYELPNSHIRVNIPTRRFYQPVQKKQNGDGVLPDKYMPFTLQDVKDNTDGPLTYILDSLIRRN